MRFQQCLNLIFTTTGKYFFIKNLSTRSCGPCMEVSRCKHTTNADAMTNERVFRQARVMNAKRGRKRIIFFVVTRKLTFADFGA